MVLSELRALSGKPDASERVGALATSLGITPSDVHRIASDNGIALLEQSGYHARPIASNGRTLPQLGVETSALAIQQARLKAQVESHGVRFTDTPIVKTPDDPRWEWGHRMDAHLWADGERPNLFEAFEGPLAAHAARFESYRYPPAWIDRVVLSNGDRLGWLEHEAIVESYGEAIRNKSVPNVAIRSAGSAGQGVFAESDIPAGTFLGEYTGEIHIPSDEEICHIGDDYRRFRAGRHEYDPSHEEYAFTYHPYQDYSALPFAIIDAAKAGNHTRFINHDAEPNADVGYAFVDGMWHTFLVANQDIAKGTQVSFDYGQDYWNLRQITPDRLD